MSVLADLRKHVMKRVLANMFQINTAWHIARNWQIYILKWAETNWNLLQKFQNWVSLQFSSCLRPAMYPLKITLNYGPMCQRYNLRPVSTSRTNYALQFLQDEVLIIEKWIKDKTHYTVLNQLHILDPRNFRTNSFLIQRNRPRIYYFSFKFILTTCLSYR